MEDPVCPAAERNLIRDAFGPTLLEDLFSFPCKQPQRETRKVVFTARWKATVWESQGRKI